MPPMPHVNLYFTASRLTLAGCRWKKTLDSTESARLRGVSSCLTRKIERKTWLFSGSLRLSISSLPLTLIVSLRSLMSLRTRPSMPLPFFSPFSSAIRTPPRESVPGPEDQTVGQASACQLFCDEHDQNRTSSQPDKIQTCRRKPVLLNREIRA